jgi:DNA processing protein
MTSTSTATSTLPVGPRLVAARWDSLWIHGDPTALEPPLVAIVGTREADLHGAGLARTFASTLARHGISVLSGGALGIDAAAHGGALDADGRTAVVLPCGLEHLYPLRHRPLYEHVIAKGGALVSPFPPNTPPARWTFPRRNELLAALCDLLVVVQAPVASGSLLTAEAARTLGRRVLVVPASPGDPRGGGCLKLLRLGAEMCASPDDVIAALAHRDGPLQAYADTREPVRERKPSRARVRTPAHARTRAHDTTTKSDDPHESSAPSSSWALDDEPRRVYDSLASEPRHLDEITRTAELTAARTRSALLTLVLLGLAKDRGDGTFQRSG